ncbi:MAG: hypothetical protein AAGD14_18975 [Planctomycetota bacterium]
MAQKRKNLSQQVDALQKRVDELVAAQTQQQDEAPQQPKQEHAEPESALEAKFEELFTTLDEDLKEASPVTVLAVFALGLLVGRSLSV